MALTENVPEVDVGLRSELQKKGIGKAVYENLETWVKKNYEVEVFVLGVSIANNVEGFWTKMGFKKKVILQCTFI